VRGSMGIRGGKEMFMASCNQLLTSADEVGGGQGTR